MIELSMIRKDVMEQAFKELDNVVSPLIVEVGRLRSVFGQETDGFSTLHFTHYLNDKDARGAGRLISVDNDPASEIASRDILAKHGVSCNRIDFINEDALEYFREGRVPPEIDLLYLDAWDCIGLSSEPSAINHLKCFELVHSSIVGGGLLLVDDVFSQETPSGKGKYAISRAIELGYEVMVKGYAWLLRKTLQD